MSIYADVCADTEGIGFPVHPQACPRQLFSAQNLNSLILAVRAFAVDPVSVCAGSGCPFQVYFSLIVK
jgi:hypothetical protein